MTLPHGGTDPTGQLVELRSELRTAHTGVHGSCSVSANIIAGKLQRSLAREFGNLAVISLGEPGVRPRVSGGLFQDGYGASDTKCLNGRTIPGRVWRE